MLPYLMVTLCVCGRVGVKAHVCTCACHWVVRTLQGGQWYGDTSPLGGVKCGGVVSGLGRTGTMLAGLFPQELLHCVPAVPAVASQ